MAHVVVVSHPRQPQLVHSDCKLKNIVKTFALGFRFGRSVSPDVTSLVSTGGISDCVSSTYIP